MSAAREFHADVAAGIPAKATPMPDLLIFDCDGVLVDSEAISASVLSGMLSSSGALISEELVYSRFLGRSMANARHILLTEFGVTISEDMTQAMRAEMFRRFPIELKPIAGAADALALLKNPRCVASSSMPDRLRLTLGLTGLLKFFDPHIFSAAMVVNGKPAPDLFLHAAREMGAAPQSCIVIEDSPAGVEAAQAAGMKVLGFTGGAHAAKFDLAASLAALNPDAMFDDMLRLPKLLEEIAGDR